MSISKFSETTKNLLGNYVYCLCSQLNGERNLIYIGEGIGDRVFNHEYRNSSDMTEKGRLISEILAQGGSIEKYILDCGMNNSTSISGQDIAFHAENALINLARLCKLPITNTQLGHGFLKRAMLVDEIENLCSNESIDFSAFDINDRVMIYNYDYNKQTLFNSPDREKEIKDNLLSYVTYFTNASREKPKYLCVVYRSIIQMIFAIDVELEEHYHDTKYNRKYHKFTIKNIQNESQGKYSILIGKSLGKMVEMHPKTVYHHIKYTYDDKYNLSKS